MEYKIKSKLVNGEIKYGIINDRLEVVLPFEYSKIEEKIAKRKAYYESGENIVKYYILFDSNDIKGIFLDGGVSFFEPSYDYVDYIPSYDLKCSKFIVGQKNEEKMEYGILERQPINGQMIMIAHTN